MADQQGASGNMREYTAEIVASYVANNSVAQAGLGELIASVHTALTTLGQPAPEPAAAKPTPPVSIRKSVTPDYLISLEDGQQYKSLKRHLAGKGLTPSEYRHKWGLPADYPMVAPNYSAARSEMARTIGLGRKRSEPEPAKKETNGRRRAAKT